MMLVNAGKGWCHCATNIGLGRALGGKDCISKGGNKLGEQYNQGWGLLFLEQGLRTQYHAQGCDDPVELDSVRRTQVCPRTHNSVLRGE
eukprot:CAMPEP_0196238410 /NCGR_PEP_ID=MMETSP0913-20130531/7080_1 /TAXON_ID=49265 /ORGANISM="Thalassiosira rotula, Strain GSO102" /LENGTH=88 /DNA_ID=CAMNT_0041520127 /DNA_START=99 /DNA_END=362 /DNA_ORIENTATION=+